MTASAAAEVMGYQRPRLFHLPDMPTEAERNAFGLPKLGAIGREIKDLSTMAGLDLDDWQCWVLENGCEVRKESYYNPYTKRREPKWAAFEVGVVVSRQNGKGDQDHLTPILTDSGWKTMGSVVPGDRVFGSNGKLTRVVATSPLYTDSHCYEVSMSDGSTYIVGADHLWHVSYRGGDWRDMRTGYLASRVGGRRPGNGRMEYNWRVRCDAVVDTPEALLPIDPYLLGYWLGDGTTGYPCVTVGMEDQPWSVARLKMAGATEMRRNVSGGGALQWHFRIADKGSHEGFRGQLKALEIFDEKGIPEVYLTASIEQRKQLLAGLMDSDGHIASTNKSPQVELTTSVPRLADDFLRLARSLGIRVSRKQGKSTLNGVRKKDRARFLWTPTFNPFQMPRKADKWRAPISRRHELMSITSITPVPTVPTRCIQVAAQDGVYLVGHNFTPTHNSILEARELAGLFLFGERLLLHTAHLFDTSLEAFNRVLFLIENTPDLEKEVQRVSKTHGSEGITLKNGQRLLFKARTGKGGRGFTGDFLAWDEAMFLSDTMVGAQMPLLSARPNSQIWYTGSAGMKESTQFGRVRRNALKHSAPRLFFAEWSIDPHSEFCKEDCTRHNRSKRVDLSASPEIQALQREQLIDSFARANPGLGMRITIEGCEVEHASMDPDEFDRERLGVGDWPGDGEEWAVIREEAWHRQTDQHSSIEGGFVLGIGVAPDKRYSSIGAAGLNDDGVGHVELTSKGNTYDHRPGTGWLLDAIKGIKSMATPRAVVIDPAGFGGELKDDLTKMGLTVLTPTTREVAIACGAFKTGISPHEDEGEPTIVHIGQPNLTRAVAGCDKRDLADMWAWDKRSSSVDISPLDAVTLAMWGFRKLESTSVLPWVRYR